MAQLMHSLATYRIIRDRLIALGDEIDETTLVDTLDGLTDLHEVIAAIVRSALIDETLAAGLKGHVSDLQERLRRLTGRAANRRRLARDAMLEVELKKIAAPDFTLSIRSGSAAVHVIDEAAIPSSYWKPRDPTLDRGGLLSDLKAGVSIAGVTLANPEPVLSVRVR